MSLWYVRSCVASPMQALRPTKNIIGSNHTKCATTISMGPKSVATERWQHSDCTHLLSRGNPRPGIPWTNRQVSTTACADVTNSHSSVSFTLVKRDWQSGNSRREILTNFFAQCVACEISWESNRLRGSPSRRPFRHVNPNFLSPPRSNSSRVAPRVAERAVTSGENPSKRDVRGPQNSTGYRVPAGSLLELITQSEIIERN